MKRSREDDDDKEEASAGPQSADKLAQAALRASSMPEEYRREVIFTFDGERHDIRGLVARMLLGETAHGSQLAALHLDPAMVASCTHGRPSLVNKRWRNRGVVKDKHADEFRYLFGRFMEEVVCKELGCEHAVFQESPILRCHPPGLKPLGHAHRDEMYNRQPCEVNIWLPLTPVFGNNSLWVESARDVGDFHPFVAEWGQAIRFWGHQVMHMTKANDTTTTRVSLDCRIVPSHLYVDDYVSPLSKSGRIANRLGQGYTDTALERAWREQYRPSLPPSLTVSSATPSSNASTVCASFSDTTPSCLQADSSASSTPSSNASTATFSDITPSCSQTDSSKEQEEPKTRE